MARRLRRRKSSNSISNDSNIKSPLLLPVDEKRINLRKSSKTTTNFVSRFCFCYPTKEPESCLSIILQISLVFGTFLLCLYTYFWFDHFHYYLTRFYAEHVDDHHAQHVLGHKLIRNHSHAEAFQWFRRAADQGHAHSAYNLALGHLSGYRTDVKQGEVRQLLRFAAKNGVEEAQQLLRGLCRERPKYCDL